MVKFRRSKKAGLPPGTLVHIGDQKVEQVKVQIIEYDKGRYNEKEIENAGVPLKIDDSTTVTWINVIGLHKTEIIEQIGQKVQLHKLILEDIVNTHQRPKMDDLDEHLFLIIKTITYDETSQEIFMEQVSIILGENFVISFQESEKGLFDPIRERIRKGKGRIRNQGPDYLAYALMDTIVDRYFLVLEQIGEKIEGLEESLLEDSAPKETARVIHHLKKELIFVRKAVWPLREILATLEKGDTDIVKEKTTIFLKDVYDHTVQIIETVETYRDMLSGLLDLHLTLISSRLNQVMKVLTIIATIFIPLTFIAGIYGMNFKNMPELEWQSGYFIILGIMCVIGVVMLFWFKMKKWL